MTATVPTMTNGRPQRKQLSDQLDRLDSIIDALAEGLPEAVAAAAREGTRAAVKDAIVEIISNPELRGLMQSIAPVVVPTPAPSTTSTEPTVVEPSPWAKLRANLAAARVAISERYRAAKDSVTTTMRTLSMLMPLRRIVLVAVGVGIVAAILGYIAPAGVAAVIAGIGGMVSALAAQVSSWFRRSKRMFQTT